MPYSPLCFRPPLLFPIPTALPNNVLCYHIPSLSDRLDSLHTRWWRWRRSLQLGILGHHTLEADTHALDDSEQDRATDRAVAHSLETAADGERAAREAACDDGVPWVFLFAVAFDGAVEGGEEAAPDAEVAAEDRGAGFYCCEGWGEVLVRDFGRMGCVWRGAEGAEEVVRLRTAYSSFAVGTVAESFHAVPYCAAVSLAVEACA